MYFLWLSSVSHLFSSLTTQPPFWERKKRTKLKRGASPLSEKTPRLPAVPMNKIHQNLLRRHHHKRQEFRSTFHLPSFHLLVLVSCTEPQRRLSTCTTAVCAHHQRAQRSRTKSPCSQLRGTSRFVLILGFPMFDLNVLARKTTARTAFFPEFPILLPKFLFRIFCSILLFTIVFKSVIIRS